MPFGLNKYLSALESHKIGITALQNQIQLAQDTGGSERLIAALEKQIARHRQGIAQVTAQIESFGLDPDKGLEALSTPGALE